MTPLELDILLHYYCCANDYRDGDFSAPAVRQTIELFKHMENPLLMVDHEPTHATYKLTERGHFYIRHLLSIPLPERRVEWFIPPTEQA